MYKRGYKNVAIVGNNNSFSKAYIDTFESNFKGKIVFKTTITSTSDVPRTDIVKLKASNPQAVFVSDVTFFLSGGMKIMKEYGLNIPVFSQYSTEFSFVRPLAEGVFYSYPLLDDQSKDAIYEITQEAYKLSKALLQKCGNDTKCIKSELDHDNRFNENGIFDRKLVLKAIKDGSPELAP